MNRRSYQTIFGSIVLCTVWFGFASTAASKELCPLRVCGSLNVQAYSFPMTKLDGKSWDALGGPPDVRFSFSEQTAAGQKTRRFEKHQGARGQISVNERVVIRHLEREVSLIAEDVDMQDHDHMATFTFVPSKLKPGKNTLRHGRHLLDLYWTPPTGKKRKNLNRDLKKRLRKKGSNRKKSARKSRAPNRCQSALDGKVVWDKRGFKNWKNNITSQ